MQSLMMDRALTLPSILEYAAQYHPHRQVVDRMVEGPIHRYGYAEALVRTKRMANALIGLGVKPGDRVATLAWSTHRHFELYFAVTGIGAVLHTINPRLSDDQIVWVANHAEDGFLFYDNTFAAQVAELKARMPTVTRFVAMTDRPNLPADAPADALVYEDLIDASSPEFAWPELDERQASGLCYTSGTTGHPKGVLYSHRSTVLHAMALGLPDAFDFSARSVVMPCAQMYHANAWCTPYAAPLVGASLVLPGRALDGASIAELIESEGVTFLLGVPTIWVGVADHLEQTGGRLTSVETIAIGGSAPTAALVSRIEDRLGGQVRQIWGMTETSPLGVINTPLPEHAGGRGDRAAAQAEAGPGPVGRRPEDHGRGRRGAAARWAERRRPAGPRALGGRRLFQARRGRGVHRRRLVRHRRHRDHRRRGLPAPHRPGQGRDQVGRGMDLDAGPGGGGLLAPGGRHGRRGGRPASQVGRAAAVAGDAAPRPDGGPGRPEGPRRRPGRQVVDAGRGADRRRPADRAHRQGPEA
jgi:acyl-CoA synthetase (AMP-forming)/AMP-acid ligase II